MKIENGKPILEDGENTMDFGCDADPLFDRYYMEKERTNPEFSISGGNSNPFDYLETLSIPPQWPTALPAPVIAGQTLRGYRMRYAYFVDAVAIFHLGRLRWSGIRLYSRDGSAVKKTSPAWDIFHFRNL